MTGPEIKSTGTRPLSGRRVLVTRSAEQAPALQNALVELGAEAIVVPTIEIVPPPSYRELDQAIAGLPGTDFLLLTSVNAVRAVLDRLSALGLDDGALVALQTVAVGPKTAEALAARGVHVDLIPEDYRAEGIVELLRPQVNGKRVLYPKAALARDLIPLELREAGAEVIDPVAYASAPPPGVSNRLRQVLAEGLDLLTFTASSTVENFADLLEPDTLETATRIPIASIGPLTSSTARKRGFHVVVEPDKSTLEDMVESIAKYFAGLQNA